MVFEHAVREFRRAFTLTGPGGRDFAWLTALLFVTILLGLLLAATRRGLVENQISQLLAALPGYGAPVWFIPDSSSGPNRIREEFLASKDPRYLPRQYKELDLRDGSSGLRLLEPLSPPHSAGNGPEEHAVWRRDILPLAGWGVRPDDPLRKWASASGASIHPAAGAATLPLEMIAVRKDFDDAFNTRAYLHAVRDHLPPPVAERVALALAPLLAEAPAAPRISDHLAYLWMEAGAPGQLVPVALRWVDRLPTIQRISFLLPMETVAAINHADRKSLPLEQLSGFTLRDLQPEFGVIPATEWSRCVAVTVGGRSVGDPVPPLDEVRRRFRIGDKHDIGLDGDLIRARFKQPRPCWLVQAACQGTGWVCTSDEKHEKLKDFAFASEAPGYYDRAIAYIRDPHQIASVSEDLRKQFNLKTHPMIVGNISRVNYFVSIVDIIRNFILFSSVFVMTVAMSSQVATIVGHRRQRYGRYLVNGWTWRHIHAMLACELVMSWLAAWVAALGGAFTIAWLSCRYSVDLIDRYRDIANDGAPFILLWQDVVAVLGGSLFVVLAAGALTLLMSGIRKGVAPARLLDD